MSPSVTVTTGARLHFGLLVQGEPDRRTYGGLGLMIDQPRFTLTVRFAETDVITASPGTTARIPQILSRLRSVTFVPACEISVHEEIPAHAGLGSGTQLALALATAVHRLQSPSPPNAQELARWTGRSQRSAIGTVGFAAGGLILDAGRPGGDLSDPVTTRYDFPADWRFVLVTPPSHPGLSGDSERDAFRQLPPMNDQQLKLLNDLLRRLPADIEQRNFAACSTALYDFGRQVGEYFAPIQGGIFASPRMVALAEQLRAEGLPGVGQTSWGPTLFALCAGQVSAESVAATIRQSHAWSDCEVRIAAAMNRGAKVLTDESRSSSLKIPPSAGFA